MNHGSRTARAALGGLLAALLLAGCGLSPDAASRVAKAREYRADGELQSALIELKNALKDDPANVEARTLLGEVSLEAGDPASAIKEFEKAMELGADAASLRVSYGAALREAGNHAELIKLVDGAKGATPEQTARLGALQAEALMGLGQAEEAGAALAAAVAADPKPVDVRLAQVRLALGTGRLDEAQQLVTALAGDAKTDHRYWELRAQLALRRNDPAAAAAAYREGMTAIDDPVGARRFMLQGGLTEVLLGSGDVAGARTEIAAMLKQSPRHPLPNYLLSRADYQEGHYKDALAHAQAVISVLPSSAHALMLAGASAIKLGQAAQGESYLASAVRADPAYLPARQLLAEARLGRGAASEAMETLMPAFESGSSDPGLLALLGQASAQAGTLDQAIALYSRRLVDEPDNHQLRIYLAASLMASGRNDEASRELQKISSGDANEKLRAELLGVIARLRDGDLAGARTQAAVIRSAQAGNADALQTLGTLFMGARAWDDARAQFNAALAVNPRHVAARLNLGRLDAFAGNPDAASARFKAVLADQPRNVDAMVALAGLAQAAGDKAGTVAWLEKARAADKAALQPRLLLAEHHLREKAPDKARAVADEAVAAHPDSAQAANALAVVMAAQGQMPGARDQFARAADLAPTWPEARFNTARAEIALGNVEAARKNLEAAIALDPGYVNALAVLTAVELRSERVTEAARHFEALQRKDPDGTLTRLLQGDLLFAQKRPAEARTAYAAVLKQTGDQRAAFGVYQAARAAGDANAVGVLEDWLKAHPTDQAARMLLAEGRYARGDKAQAIAAYEQVVAAMPDNAAALNNLAVAYQEAGDKRAVATARKAWSLAPQSGAVADTLGWILHQQGDRQRALELLQKAAELAPGVAEIRYHLAVALNDGGDAKRARAELEAILSDKAAVAMHDQAQQLLQRLKPVT